FGYNDCIFYRPQSVLAGTVNTWKLIDCQLTGFFDTCNYAISSDNANLTMVMELKHCTINILSDRTATDHIARGISYGSAFTGNLLVRLTDCNFTVAGANTSADYGIYSPAAGAKTINFVADVINTSI